MNRNIKKLKLSKIVWVSYNKDVIKFLQKKGLKAYYMFSFFSLWNHLRAGYFFFDTSLSDIVFNFSKGAVLINLWHGVPLKRIGEYQSGKNNPFYNLMAFSGKSKNTFFTLCSSVFSMEIFCKAFSLEEKQCVCGVFPRIEYLKDNDDFDDYFENMEMIETIKDFKRKKIKILGYFPTFRDNFDTKILGCFEMPDDFDAWLKENNFVLLIKRHFVVSKGEKNKESSERIIFLDPKYDVFPYLKLTDILITDYSSLALDFLCLDKKIIFFPYDFGYYKTQDRGFIYDYETMSPGVKVYNLEQLKKELLSNEDTFKKERRVLQEKIFPKMDFEKVLEKLISL